MVFLAGPDILRADIMPGVDHYVRNAEAILLVRAMAQEQAANELPSKRQWFVVENVLKGFYAPRESRAMGPHGANAGGDHSNSV